MKRYDRLQWEMLERVGQFELDHPVTPPIPRATALFAQANSQKGQLQERAGLQVHGRGGFRAGATERRLLAKDLRTVLVDMAATARGLELAHPGITDQFRLGRASRSHVQLLATARAFLTAIAEPAVKQLFTDRAFPADFDVQLTAMIAGLAAASARRATGLQAQREGSEGLSVLNREISATMRELRPLMVKYLRDTNPTLLAVWNGAARMHSPPVFARSGTEPEPGGASGSGSNGPAVMRLGNEPSFEGSDGGSLSLSRKAGSPETGGG